MPESQGLFSLKKQICPLLQIVLGALRVKHFLICLCACAHKPNHHIFLFTWQQHIRGIGQDSLFKYCKFVKICEPLSPPPPPPHSLQKKKKKKKKKKNVKSKKQFP